MLQSKRWWMLGAIAVLGGACGDGTGKSENRDTETEPDSGQEPDTAARAIIEDGADCDAMVRNDAIGLTGYWYAANAACDEGLPGEQTPACDADPFPMTEADGGGCVAHTEGGGFPNSESQGWGWALIGVDFGQPFDACDWGGIGVTVSGTPVRVKVPIPATSGDADHFGATISAGAHTIAWEALTQEGWGAAQTFDCSAVNGIFFQAGNPVAFDFSVHGISLVSAGELDGGEPVAEIPDGREPGDFIGEANNTYYWFLEESDYGASETVTLVDTRCAPLVEVDADFAADVCLEGSGRLADGRLVNLMGTCDCGFPCGGDGEGTCFFLPDPDTFPWGVGSASNPLVPLVSVAANDLRFGQVLYIPAFDGLEIPSVDGLGGGAHDGCFRVDDEGYSFGGAHVDVFAGTPDMYSVLEGLIPTHAGLDIYDGAAHCFAAAHAASSAPGGSR